jgi:hypothetical protein
MSVEDVAVEVVRRIGNCLNPTHRQWVATDIARDSTGGLRVGLDLCLERGWVQYGPPNGVAWNRPSLRRLYLTRSGRDRFLVRQ